MADLRHITRGNSDTRGKSKVFFTCHPEDFARCADPIQRMLLEHHNCAVYWLPREQSGVSVEERAEILSQMQLIVIPVTTKLLTSPNPAMDFDVPFALDRHIPILPLMQEPGLDELFRKRFGDLQFLDPGQSDPTALSFDEKLDTFLQGVLVDDDLAEIIRSAFDAYIFLSYRKKDRKYALSLMERIHRQERCQDVAIWYDEFLTPGENYNDAIREALVKSDLFVMAVTPNLVNEPNYVMTTEYPLARRLSKPILPALLVPTDTAALATHYPGISCCIDASSAEQLCRGLAENLRHVDLRAHDGDPCHNYYIGLAYLNGIDVETDAPRAVRLIRSAANADFPEAAEMLARMYRHGIGVERDGVETVRWQEKLVEILRESNAPDALFNAIWGLCRDLMEQSQAESIHRRYLIDDLEDIVWELQRNPERDCRLYRLRIYLLKGALAEIRGESPIREYERAHGIAQELVDEQLSAESLRLLIQCCEKLGDAQAPAPDRKTGFVFHTAKGIDWYDYALELSEQLANLTGAVEDRRSAAVLHRKYAVRGAKFANTDRLKKALDLQKSLAEETQDPEDYRNLVLVLIALGQSWETTSRVMAKDFYSQALELAGGLAQETHALCDMRLFARCGSYLHAVLEACGQADQGENLLYRCTAMMEAVVKIGGSRQELRELADLHKNLAVMRIRKGSNREAAESVWKYVALSESGRSSEDYLLNASRLMEQCGDTQSANKLMELHLINRMGL